MLKYLVIFFLLFVTAHAQQHRILVGGYTLQGSSIDCSYYYDLDSSIFISPSYGAHHTKDEKEIYSFGSYSINIGYYLYRKETISNYLSIGLSYNNFLEQHREGNAKLISDTELPRYFTGETKQNCLGLIGKAGVMGKSSWGFVFGCEVKYVMIFPKIKYNYLPSEYSAVEGPKFKGLLYGGLLIGFQF